MNDILKRIKFIYEYATHLQTDNSPPLELIYKFINELDKKEAKAIFHKFSKDKSSERIFNEEKSALDRLNEDEFKERTIGAEFQTWLKQSEGAVDLFKFGVFGRTEGKTKFKKFLKHTCLQHDLIHFLNGYDVTPLGEVGVITFNLAQEWRPSFATILYASFLMSIRNTFLPSKYPANTQWHKAIKYSPLMVFCKVVREAWKRGKQSEWFLTVDWNGYLDTDLKQVKEKLKLEKSPTYWDEVQPVWARALRHYKKYEKNKRERQEDVA